MLNLSRDKNASLKATNALGRGEKEKRLLLIGY